MATAKSNYTEKPPQIACLRCFLFFWLPKTYNVLSRVYNPLYTRHDTKHDTNCVQIVFTIQTIKKRDATGSDPITPQI